MNARHNSAAHKEHSSSSTYHRLGSGSWGAWVSPQLSLTQLSKVLHPPHSTAVLGQLDHCVVRRAQRHVAVIILHLEHHRSSPKILASISALPDGEPRFWLNPLKLS